MSLSFGRTTQNSFPSGLAVRVAPELVNPRAAGGVSRTVANAGLCLVKGPWRR
jgi:hypothetical protein